MTPLRAPASCPLLGGLAAAAMAVVALTAPCPGQIPDGHYVWTSQQGTLGRNGVWFSHPRDPLVPVGEITNLPPALAYEPAGRRGAASVLYRGSDGALLAGERAPAGTSVDLHVLRLRGSDVVFVHTFSVGISVNFGEIPQAALLPDGRVVVAASDLAAGSVLAQALTAQYNWQGLGIIDTLSGSVTPIPVTNIGQLPGVINGLAVSPDGSTIYLCNWITNGSGDLWSVPVTGGTAVQLAVLPAGPSNVVIDNDGTVLLSTLNQTPDSNLWRYDPLGGAVTQVPTSTGGLNCVALEAVTGNYVLGTREWGTPPRSLYWMTPSGQQHLLVSPDRATITGIAVNPNPEVVAAGTPGQASYGWQLAPNPGGMPLVGNQGFSLTVRASSGITGVAAVLLGFPLAQPVQVMGLAIHVDPATAITTLLGFQAMATVPLPIPNLAALRGVALMAQSLHLEGAMTLAASPGVLATIL